MEAGVVPGHLHLERPNQDLDLGRLPIQVARESRAWPGIAGEPRRAGVSAFGFSGTNAHVIVEQAPAVAAVSASGPGVFTISAANTAALRVLAARWANWLAAHDELRVADVCAAALRGRSALECRLALAADSVPQLAAALREFAETGRAPRVEMPVDGGGPWPRLSMPTYPFQRSRHWMDAPVAAAAAVDSRADLLAWLTRELATIMGEADPARLDPRRGFADLGLDSLMAGQLADAVERELGVEVPVMTVFNYPTLQDLAAHLEAYAGT
jgi:acyl transferase domain-containing protein